MTKKDRVVKLLNEQELLIGSAILMLENDNLVQEYQKLYDNLERAYENNHLVQEEITY